MQDQETCCGKDGSFLWYAVQLYSSRCPEPYSFSQELMRFGALVRGEFSRRERAAFTTVYKSLHIKDLLPLAQQVFEAGTSCQMKQAYREAGRGIHSWLATFSGVPAAAA